MTQPAVASTGCVRDLTEQQANKTMLCIIAVSTGLFTWLAYLQYANFTTDTNDLTIVTYAFAQTLKGRFFPLYYDDGSLLGNHPNLIYMLLFPVYAVVQKVPFLLFLQSLIISASAWPLYLLARRKLSDNLAVVGIVTAYLVFPTVASQHLNQIHDDQFANISILFAAYFFDREKFRHMSIALVLAALTKEVVALTVAMFGVWAWLNKRSAKWIIFPMVLGFGWFFIGVRLMFTLLPGAGAVLYSGTPYLDLYGKSPREVLHTMFNRPDFVLENTFSPLKQHYLVKLFGPLLLILPFFSSAVVLSLPNLAINLVGTNTALIHIPWHYGVVLGATLFVAIAFSLPRICAWLSGRFGSKRYARATAALLFAAGLLSTSMWLDTARFRPVPHLSTLQRAVASVPLNASVIATTPTLAHFSNHPKVNSAYSIFYGGSKGKQQLEEFDYVLLDGNWRTGEAFAQGALYDAVKNDPSYQPVFIENNVLLLRRVK